MRVFKILNTEFFSEIVNLGVPENRFPSPFLSESDDKVCPFF
jgi:hypothetical protein